MTGLIFFDDLTFTQDSDLVAEYAYNIDIVAYQHIGQVAMFL